jgi:hypothetical protein
VQVGEIGLGSRRSVERFHVGLELDEIPGDEARRDAEVAQQLHQQPARVAAGTARGSERFLRRLDAGLHADEVLDVLRQAHVQRHQEIHRRRRRARNGVEVALEAWRERAANEIRRKLVQLFLRVAEGKIVGAWFEEEVERIDDRHLGHQVHLDPQFARGFGKHQARQPVRLRVLLPVEEMFRRRDALRVREHRSARMRRRAQANHLRSEQDRTVVAIVGYVTESDVYRHA